MDGTADAWFDVEIAGCSLADERLTKRLRKLLAQLGSAIGQSIPLVCQDWTNANAAYRFFRQRSGQRSCHVARNVSPQ